MEISIEEREGLTSLAEKKGFRLLLLGDEKPNIAVYKIYISFLADGLSDDLSLLGDLLDERAPVNVFEISTPVSIFPRLAEGHGFLLEPSMGKGLGWFAWWID